MKFNIEHHELHALLNELHRLNMAIAAEVRKNQALEAPQTHDPRIERSAGRAGKNKK